MNTLVELYQSCIGRAPERVFVQIRTGRRSYRGLTYGEMAARVEAFRAELAGRGVSPGDRVALLSESCPEWGIAFFALQTLGATVVTVDVKLTPEEMAFVVGNAESILLIHTDKFTQAVAGIAPPKGRLLLTDAAGAAPAGPIPRQAVQSPADPAVIIYTSGTTANPKGVVLTQGNLASEVRLTRQAFPDLFNQASFLSVLPLNHAYEITGGFLCPFAGASTITYAGTIKSNILLEVMQDTQPTAMLAVPALLNALYGGIQRRLQGLPAGARLMAQVLTAVAEAGYRMGLPLGRWLFPAIHRQFGGRLRCFISGGAPLDPEIIHRFGAYGITVYQGYGLTETSPITAVNTPRANRIGSVGRPLPDTEVRIVPPDGAAGPEGEIWLRGPHIMAGYYNNPAATAEALQDGWFRTGDLGRVDGDGFLYITGRLKNLIVTDAGKKIIPEELEEHLTRAPIIKEACVLGKRAGAAEEVAAVIVPDLDWCRSRDLTPDQTRQAVRAAVAGVNRELASYKKIASFEIWDQDLPKTTTLKIKRGEIRALVEGSASPHDNRERSLSTPAE